MNQQDGTNVGSTGRLEMDSHADTSTAGGNMLLVAYTGQVCDVYGFSDSMAPLKQVPIVTAATAYDDRYTGETIILLFNQVPWLGTGPSLINPNQVRAHGLRVQDNPYDTFIGVEGPNASEGDER